MSITFEEVLKELAKRHNTNYTIDYCDDDEYFFICSLRINFSNEEYEEPMWIFRDRTFLRPWVLEDLDKRDKDCSLIGNDELTSKDIVKNILEMDCRSFCF